MAKATSHFYIELGSHQTRACFTHFNEDGKPVLSMFAVQSKGIALGQIRDQALAKDAVNSLLEDVDSSGLYECSKCILCLPPAVTTFRTIDCSVRLNGLSVSKDHRVQLLSEAQAAICDDTQELVEIVEQNWRLDGQLFDQFPTGKIGEQIVLSGFCVVIEKNILKDLVEVLNASGLSIIGTKSSILGAKRLIERLSPDLSNRAILDFGYQSTSGILCVGSKENSTFVVKAGSQHVTRDIAAAMQIDLSIAESLKIEYGLSTNRSEPNTSESKGSHSIYPWAAPRVLEIVSLCLRNFAIYAKALDGGVILMGGGSQLQEICGFLGSKFLGIKFTRFKPSFALLSDALSVDFRCSDESNIIGFEGMIGIANEQIEIDRIKMERITRQTPKFLRPILSWFVELSK
ncbi:MAG: hypothetical protein NT027_10275 [Proteobacteria bacterium]|nr:hypothetical protein [Pseudomonadota bacterium]